MKKTLKKSKILQWIQLTFPIPIGILTAQLISQAVSCAVNGKVQNTAKLGIGILCISIAEKLIGILLKIYYENTSSAALHKCKLELYRQFLANPLDILFVSDHGAATERLNDDFDCLTARELSTYPSLWTGLLTAAAYFCYLFSKSRLLALTLTAISVLQIIPPLIVKRFLQINYDNTREIEEELSDFIAEGYRGFATIKLYDLKEWWLDGLKVLHKRYLKIGNRSEATLAVHQILSRTVENILKYGTYAIIGLFVLLEAAEMQTGVAAISLSSGLYAAVKRMTEAISQLSVAEIAVKRLTEWTPGTGSGESSLRGGDIQVNRLGFSYGEADISREISVEFSGEAISVIKGENGIGKSTLLRLITGLIPSEEGSVLIGGESPHSLAASQFPRSLCYLPQEDPPFDFPAMELYRMLVPRETDTVLHIAGEFGLTEDILRRTKIRELSGGERKKVFLSLALSLEPILLLLDEPANSLDFAGKETLKRCLARRSRGTLIITHDDVFDDIADSIYFMDKEGVKLHEG